MQVKLLHDLVEEIAGENTGRIVEILFKKKDVNEFLIAKKMELTINQVRNILYKLSADNLVSFIRKKDKRKGWYIYFWTLNTEKCLAKLENSLVEKIHAFGKILNNRETRRFYVCKACDIEVSEEKALEHGFSCEECADVYELSDNKNPIREIKTKTTRVKNNLVLIQGELEAVRKRLKIAKKRALNKLEKEKQAKKEFLKAARLAAKKKIEKDKARENSKVKSPVNKKISKPARTASKKNAPKKIAKSKTLKKNPAKKIVKKKSSTGKSKKNISRKK